MLRSFFGRRFGNERALAELYADLYEANGVRDRVQARVMGRIIVQTAKRFLLQEYPEPLPTDYGEKLLARATSEPAVRAQIDALRAESVTDHDIRFWWSMDELERQSMLVFDELSRTTAFLSFTERQGMTPEEAVSKMRKTVVIYGDPNDTKHATGDDRPLPVELKERVNLFLEKAQGTGPIKTGIDPVGYTSMNAYVRAKVREGII